MIGLATHRPDLQPPQLVGDGVRHVPPEVLVDPGGTTGPPHHGRGAVVAQFQGCPDRQPDRVVTDTADDHDRGTVRLEPCDAGVVRAEQPVDLLGHRHEDLRRVEATGDQRGYAAKRGLLIQQGG
jgi:hypothetical protein